MPLILSCIVTVTHSLSQVLQANLILMILCDHALRVPAFWVGEGTHDSLREIKNRGTLQ